MAGAMALLIPQPVAGTAVIAANPPVRMPLIPVGSTPTTTVLTPTHVKTQTPMTVAVWDRQVMWVMATVTHPPIQHHADGMVEIAVHLHVLTLNSRAA